MTQRTGIFVLSLLCVFSTFTTLTAQEPISRDVDDLKYYYYPTSSQPVEIVYNDRSSLEASNLKAATKTILIIDGFLSDSTSPMNRRTTASYTSRSNENVIVIDWGRLSGSGIDSGNATETINAYIIVLGNVGPIGHRVAEFLDFLRANKEIQFSDVTIVGHSLGAHIGGAAGVYAKGNFSGQIDHIVGLDPAGPFFSYQLDPDRRLHKGDAAFVDIYHTSNGTLGISDHDTGDVNVYVNGGRNQPGCADDDQSGFVGGCSHSYSWKFFNYAFTNTIEACPCTGESCTCTSCEYTCDIPSIVGPNINTSLKGRYYFRLGPLQ